MAKQPKLTKLLEDIFQEQPQINKFEVIEGVRSFGVVGKSLYNNSNILEVAKQLSKIAENAHTHVVSEQDDWFDKVSINKNMQSLKRRVAEFKKAAGEAHQLNQRMTGLYEDMGHILNRYYDINEGEEGQLDQEPNHNNDGNINDLEEGEDTQNSVNQIDPNDPSEPNIKNSANVNESDKGDMDGDGKDEPDEDEYMDAKDKAIKKAMGETYRNITKRPTMKLKDIANSIVGLKAVGNLNKRK